MGDLKVRKGEISKNLKDGKRAKRLKVDAN